MSFQGRPAACQSHFRHRDSPTGSLAPVYFQIVGHFVLNDQDNDRILGASVSYAIFEHVSQWNIARLYFELEGGGRYQKRQELNQEMLTTTTLGAGLAFGGELVFSLGGIPLGLNVKVGQGVGRETTNSQSKGRAGVYVGTGIHAYFWSLSFMVDFTIT